MNAHLFGECDPGTRLILARLTQPVLTLWVSTSILELGGWERGFRLAGAQRWKQAELMYGSGTLMYRCWTSLCIPR